MKKYNVRSTVLFLTWSENQPSTKYRVHQYLDGLHQSGFRTELFPAGSMNPGRRYDLLRKARCADIVFIQKKLFHPIFLRILRKMNANIIFDFDDALFAREPYNPTIREMSPGSDSAVKRLNSILKVSKVVVAGNFFLSQYARRYNPRVRILPTPVNLSNYRPPPEPEDRERRESVLGWIGTSNNLYYLERLRPVLERIARQNSSLKISVLCNKDFKPGDLPVENRSWEPDTELKWMHDIDIGLMPLEHDDWSRGKCSFKLLQYMAAGIPTVSSPVGMNGEVIEDGVNGFLADTEEEWVEKLAALIGNIELRAEMGSNGVKTVRQKYSLSICIERFKEILLETVDQGESHG